MFIAARARVVIRALASVPLVSSDADVEPLVTVAQVLSPRRNVVELAVPLPSLAVEIVPDVICEAANSLGVICCQLAELKVAPLVPAAERR